LKNISARDDFIKNFGMVRDFLYILERSERMKNVFVKATSALLVVILSCFVFVSCGDKENPENKSSDVIYTGEGNTTFTFEVEDKDGKIDTFIIKTDKEFLSDALLGLNLIAGEDSQYGLYVKTVNGITYDYNTDGMYWALYADGEYSLVGVSSLKVEDGHTYKFKAEK
jgi:hypothetical protein